MHFEGASVALCLGKVVSMRGGQGKDDTNDGRMNMVYSHHVGHELSRARHRATHIYVSLGRRAVVAIVQRLHLVPISSVGGEGRDEVMRRSPGNPV